MPILKAMILPLAALVLGACVATEPASRGEMAPTPRVTGQSSKATMQVVPLWSVKEVSVSVPQTLKVSEANLFKPMADIVWRGDPRGDRYAQVRAISEAAAQGATASMRDGQPVRLEIEVNRFHALTEKARYSAPFGGRFEFEAIVTLRDAATGQVIGAPRMVARDFPAATGAKAMEEEAAGITQKQAVTEAFAQMIRDELTRPVALPALAEALPPVGAL